MTPEIFPPSITLVETAVIFTGPVMQPPTFSDDPASTVPVTRPLAPIFVVPDVKVRLVRLDVALVELLTLRTPPLTVVSPVTVPP